jgi:hypothetical protein
MTKLAAPDTSDTPDTPAEAEKAAVQNALATCDPAGTDEKSDFKLVYCETEIVAKDFGKFYCIDGDGDGVCTSDSLTDMMVLGGIVLPPDKSDGQKDYRLQMATANFNDDEDTKKQLGYELLVMVYRASAFKSADIKINNQPVSNMINNAALASRFSEGGEEIERPLFTVTSEVPPTVSSFQNLRDRLGGD